MHIFAFIPHYIRWHYSGGIRDLVHNAISFVSFLSTFFSLGTLFHTLFEPWQRLGEEYTGGFHPEKAASAFLVNTIMRVFGFTVRVVTLIVGFVVIVCAMLLALLALCIWILYPVVLLFFLSLALKYIFS
jgi:hypothetical protein